MAHGVRRKAIKDKRTAIKERLTVQGVPDLGGIFDRCQEIEDRIQENDHDIYTVNFPKG